jgi:hypothetical protein
MIPPAGGEDPSADEENSTPAHPEGDMVTIPRDFAESLPEIQEILEILERFRDYVNRERDRMNATMARFESASRHWRDVVNNTDSAAAQQAGNSILAALQLEDGWAPTTGHEWTAVSIVACWTMVDLDTRNSLIGDAIEMLRCSEQLVNYIEGSIVSEETRTRALDAGIDVDEIRSVAFAADAALGLFLRLAARYAPVF